MNDSIFSKIIRGDIPSHKIYEDEHCFAFLDIHPIAAGHTLVVAKKSVEFVWDLDDETYLALMGSVQKIARHLRQRLAAPYIGQQIVGVDVPHAHVHLVPFTTIKDYHHQPDMSQEPDHRGLSKLADRLRLP